MNLRTHTSSRTPRKHPVATAATLALALFSVRCTANYDDVAFVPDEQFAAGSQGGGTSSAGGSAGKGAAGSSGSSGVGGSAGASGGKSGASGAGGAGAAGMSGAAGNAGGGAAGAAGSGGKSGAAGQAGGGGSGGGQGGSSGSSGKSAGGAGQAGTAGKSGAGGTQAGAAGVSGAGAGGSSGSGGQGGAGQGGAAGTSGTAGQGGAGAAGSAGQGGAGAAGQGGAGASGTAGAGGGGIEDCSNGVDDNQDGLVDCADTVTCSASTCAPAPAVGWVGPLSLLDGDVGCGAQQKVFHAFSGLSAPPASCTACTCSPVAGASCVTSIHGVTGQDCEFDPCGPLSLTAPVSCASAAPLEAGCGAAAGAIESFGTAQPQGGSCQPTGASVPTLPATSWANEVTACQTTQLGGGCGADVCAPTPAPGGALCVAQAGDLACPTGYPTKRLYHESVTDSRACGTCGCAGATGGACSASIILYSDSACGTPQVAFGSSYQCQVVPMVPGYFAARSYSFAPGPVTGRACPATGGAPEGAAVPSSPITFCCTP